LQHLNINFTVTNFLLYLVLVFCGFLLYYSFSLFLHAWAFWTVKTGGFLDILIDVAEIMKYPPSIFPHLVQLILSFAIPLFMIAGYPAQISLGLIPVTFAIWNIAISLIVFGLASYFLKFALKRYSSASS
jgi:ABC-2 type transport system permease protein